MLEVPLIELVVHLVAGIEVDEYSGSVVPSVRYISVSYMGPLELASVDRYRVDDVSCV